MTQEQALNVLKTGGNVFLTGEPGAGKTYVINQYIAWLEACGLKVAVTASTGIAATHIGGMTIHAWSGIGARDTLTRYDLDQITSKEKIVKRFKKTDVLVIDEISMLGGRLLDALNLIGKTIRQNGEPFGGLQVVLVGDFYQLPPITRAGEAMLYAFESYAWQEARPLVAYLTEQHRQEDELLLSLLSSIRRNETEEEHFTLLSEQTDIGYENIEPTRLYTHNADVDTVNNDKLIAISGASRRFTMSGRGNKQLQELLIKSCLSPQTLELKEEAIVMCTKNNFEVGYVNGTLGRVVRFNEEGWPVIETAGKKQVTIEPTSWSVTEEGKVLAEISQVPLRLAWAITVHKSQGMSLDAAEIDLSRAFVYGQGYVALSRVRTLSGLKVLGMNPTALRVDPKVVTVDVKFRTESESVEESFNELGESEVEEMQKRFVVARGGHFVAASEALETSQNPASRLKEENTYEQTKLLLLSGYSIARIAKERGITESTVWTHLEKLVSEAAIKSNDLEHLTDTVNDWTAIYQELAKTMLKIGTEKLKPIYEATGERFDYNLVRLARLFFLLSRRV